MFTVLFLLSFVSGTAATADTETPDEFYEYANLYMILLDLSKDNNSVNIIIEYPATETSEAYTRTVTAELWSKGDIRIRDDGISSRNDMSFEKRNEALYTYFVFNRYESVYNIKKLQLESGEIIDYCPYEYKVNPIAYCKFMRNVI